jgi:hypothetical protein
MNDLHIKLMKNMKHLELVLVTPVVVVFPKLQILKYLFYHSHVLAVGPRSNATLTVHMASAIAALPWRVWAARYDVDP